MEQVTTDVSEIHNRTTFSEIEYDAAVQLLNLHPPKIMEDILRQQQISMGQSLEAMRKDTFFTDVTIVLEGSEISVHGNLLCAASPFFYTLFHSDFIESRTGRVELPSITRDVFEMILEFIYSGKITNNDLENFKLLLEASHFLQMTYLFQYCQHHLQKTVRKTYFLELWQLADQFDAVELQSEIELFVATHFFELTSASEFCNMTVCQFLRVLQLRKLATDITLQGVINWIKFNVEEREGDLERLLKLVNIEEVSAELLGIYLEDEIVKRNSFANNAMLVELGKRFVRKVRDSKLLCFGFDGTNSILTIFNVDLTTWSNPVILPTELKLDDSMATISFNGNVYFLGGENNVTKSGTAVYKYSVQTNVHCRLNDLKLRVHQAGVAKLNNFIYIVGESQDHNPTQRLNIVNGVTEILASTNVSHHSPIVFTFENHVYALGSSDDAQKAVEEYDPLVNQWTTITELSNPIKWSCGALCSEKLFVWPCHSITKDGLHIYDLKSGNWTRKSTSGFPPSVAFYAWAATNANSLLVQGEGRTLYIFDTIFNRWEKVASENPNAWLWNLTTFLM